MTIEKLIIGFYCKQVVLVLHFSLSYYPYIKEALEKHLEHLKATKTEARWLRCMFHRRLSLG